MSKKPRADSPEGKIIVFGAKQIRRVWVDDEWYFSVVDVVGALTDSAAPAKYWDAMKRREKESSGSDLSTLCRKVKLTGVDGKSYASEAVNTENAFRVIQSIPSPKAEPFKRWLAKVGTARNPWVPAINNHGCYGRLPFLEIADPWDAKSLIRSSLAGQLDRPIVMTY